MRKLWNRWQQRKFPGVNLVGYATAGLGLGETLRRFAEALNGLGVPFALCDINLHLGQRGRDLRLASWIRGNNPFPVNFLVISASELAAVRSHLGEAFFLGRRNVGYWFWELEYFPKEWHHAFNLVDEAWTASEFVAQALRPHARAPVRIVPHPVSVPAQLVQQANGSRRDARLRLGLPANGFMFLFAFDCHSYLQRKNPCGVIEAFRRAFGATAHKLPAAPVLVLKSSNASAAPAQIGRLRELIGHDPRIVLSDRFLPHNDQVALMAACDCYVSLHRSEGFGQGMAEAMLLGKPVIATAYSGNLSFMNGSNSALVQATLTPLAPGDYPLGTGQYWAEPDLDEAARWMQRAAADPQWCATVGARARRAILATNSPDHCARAFCAAVVAMNSPSQANPAAERWVSSGR